MNLLYVSVTRILRNKFKKTSIYKSAFKTFCFYFREYKVMAPYNVMFWMISASILHKHLCDQYANFIQGIGQIQLKVLSATI